MSVSKRHPKPIRWMALLFPVAGHLINYDATRLSYSLCGMYMHRARSLLLFVMVVGFPSQRALCMDARQQAQPALKMTSSMLAVPGSIKLPSVKGIWSGDVSLRIFRISAAN